MRRCPRHAACWCAVLAGGRNMLWCPERPCDLYRTVLSDIAAAPPCNKPQPHHQSPRSNDRCSCDRFARAP
jgi:hypothetical protein